MSDAAAEQKVLDEVPTGLFIGGGWRDATGGGRFDVEDPATGHTLATVADATPDDARAALDVAVDAQPAWARTPPRERGEILRRTFEALMARADELALLMTLEMGKPVAESKGEIAYGAEFLRWFAEEAVRIDGRYTMEPNGKGRLLVLQQPVGPCYVITPWNFPMAMATRKIGPAVAAGCTMVVKPAEATPLSLLALAQIMADAGLPPGVLNVIPTTSASGVTEPILADRRLRKLSFTGSTAVGKKLAAQAAEGVLRVSMELGGNDPFLVFEDADLDAAVEGGVLAKMRNGGEACTSANRFLVHESVADTFSRRLSERFGAMKVGRGTEPDVELGPLISPQAREKVAGLVDDAVANGARAVCGGRSVDGPGYFYEPTVLVDVPPQAALNHEEIFGPVAPIVTFSSDEEAVRLANDTEYGLVAYVFLRDLQRALRVCEALETGMVGLNRGLVSNPAAPFGGVKHSGFGREGGHEGIHEYLEPKYVAIDL